MKPRTCITYDNGRWLLNGEKYADLSPRKQQTFRYFFSLLQKNSKEVIKIITR